MTTANEAEIIKFLSSVGNGDIKLAQLSIGACFVHGGCTFMMSAVNATAWNIVGGATMAATGAVMIGAAMWLNYMKEKNLIQSHHVPKTQVMHLHGP